MEPAVEIIRPLLSNPALAPQAVARMVAAVRMFRGPLPPPEALKGYNDVVPGSGREIVEMASGNNAIDTECNFWKCFILISGGLLDLCVF